MANKNRIRLKAYEHRTLDTAAKIVETATRTGAQVAGQFHFQQNVASTQSSVRLTSTKTREQFEMRTHKRLIDIINPTQKQLTL